MCRPSTALLVAFYDIKPASSRLFNPIDGQTMRIYFLLLGTIVSGQRLDLCQRAINSGRVKMDLKVQRLQHKCYFQGKFIIWIFLKSVKDNDYEPDYTIEWPNGTETVIPGPSDTGSTAECITECNIQFLDQESYSIQYLYFASDILGITYAA